MRVVTGKTFFPFLMRGRCQELSHLVTGKAEYGRRLTQDFFVIALMRIVTCQTVTLCRGVVQPKIVGHGSFRSFVLMALCADLVFGKGQFARHHTAA